MLKIVVNRPQGQTGSARAGARSYRHLCAWTGDCMPFYRSFRASIGLGLESGMPVQFSITVLHSMCSGVVITPGFSMLEAEFMIL